MQAYRNEGVGSGPSSHGSRPLKRVWRYLGGAAVLGLGAVVMSAACSRVPPLSELPLQNASAPGLAAEASHVRAKGPASSPGAPRSIVECRCPMGSAQARPEWPDQGPALQGFGPGYQPGGVCSEARTDLPRRFRLDGMVTANGGPIRGARVEPGRLVGNAASGAALQGEQWKGVRLQAAVDCVAGAALEVQARIAAVKKDPERGAGGALLYEVDVLDPATSAWLPLCSKVDGDSGKGDIMALAFAGEWDASGVFHDTPGTFTFACTTSAAVKCAHWGYGPWDAQAAPAIHRRDAHQACIRMARADYCGDGQARTKLGTEINIWDSEKMRSPAPPKPGAGFEAAWRPEGAICIQHARYPDLLQSGLQCARPHCESQEEATNLAPARSLLLFNESMLPSRSAALRSASR